jgi:predicted TIM-barrel fold metal-dependent hydrolase
MIIDFHVHVFPAGVQADRSSYLAVDPLFRALYSSPKSRIATADDLLRSMDAAGVDVSVMQGFGWTDPDRCRRHNDDLLAAAARHSDRLRAYCTLQPADDPGAAAVEVARCLRADAAGFGELRPDGQGYLGRWDVLAGVCHAAAASGAPLLVHATEPVGHSYPGKDALTPAPLLSLVQAYPGCRFVLAHLGGGLPLYAAMPEVRASLRNVWVDTAAWPLLYGPEVFPALIAAFGAERILFGSDYPLQAQSASVERFRALELDAAVIDGVLGGNAALLLGSGYGRG